MHYIGLEKLLLGTSTIVALYTSGTSVAADEAKKYAVYYNPELEPNRNPKGSGWIPVPPERWDEVDKESYEVDYFNWEDRKSASIDYDGNECESRPLSAVRSIGVLSSDTKKEHRQSPTVLQKDEKCKDNHGMNYDLGDCKKRDVIEVSVNPYGLRTVFRRCKFRVDMDVSHSPDPWAFMGLEVKSPAEHVIRRNNTFHSYDGEIYLLHRGGNDDNHHKMLVVAIFLEEGKNHLDDPELEKYILDWEEKQRSTYEKCGITFDDSLCSLTATDTTVEVLDTSTSNSTNTTAMDEGVEFSANSNHTDDETDAAAVDTLDIGGERNLRGTGRGESAYDRLLLSSSDEERLAKTADYTPYNLWINTGNDKFYKAKGSLTHPPCAEGVEWRVMRKPLKISNTQMQRINDLIARHVDSECKLATVGDYRKDGTCHVNVNRPLQYASVKHDLKDCKEWYSD